MSQPEPPTKPFVYWSLALQPVQMWIAEAKRSRDLLVGSRLLAALMADLLVTLEQEGARLLLPHLEEADLSSLQGDLDAVISRGSSAISNRASGTLPLPLDVARDVLTSLENRLKQRWQTFVNEIRRAALQQTDSLWDLLGPEIGSPECPFDLVWAVTEGPETPEEGLRKVDALFDSVKGSRSVPVHHGEPVRKCGQCGRREALGGPDRQSWWKLQNKLRHTPEVRRGLRIDRGEYLCEVCALRRFAGYLRRDPFPSTSSIAARKWFRTLPQESGLAAARQKLVDAIRNVPGYEAPWSDPAPLYYLRTAERERHQADDAQDAPLRRALGQVLAAQTELATKVEEHNRRSDGPELAPQPSEYLAVLFFDGDDLGRRLREDLDRLPGRVRKFQAQLATRLEQRWQSEESGALALAEPFYLGGDEGLLLAPVASALAVARGVRSTWQEILGNGDGDPTLSAGLVIFDRERPLGPALESARRALVEAKALDGKDALSVRVQTASGSVWSVTGKWDRDWPRVENALVLLQEGHLASRWPYAVARLLRELGEEAFLAGRESRHALREEIRRLTHRHTRSAAGSAADGGSRPTPWEALEAESWWEEQPPEAVLSTLPSQFHLMAFLARHSGVA